MTITSPPNDTLLWQVETACRAAWPALNEVDLGGWVARYSGDAIRRTGSLNPLLGGGKLDASMLDKVEAFYTARNQPILVRYPDFLPDCSDLFSQRGYLPEGQTLTLMAPDIGAHSQPWDGVAVHTSPDSSWLAARARIAKGDRQVFEAMVGRITDPALFATAHVEGAIAAIGYGVVVDRLLIVESVATDAAFQGSGLARTMVGVMIAQASEMGVQSAALQVVSDNLPALALYRRLGFSQILYRYCYYRKSDAA